MTSLQCRTAHRFSSRLAQLALVSLVVELGGQAGVLNHQNQHVALCSVGIPADTGGISGVGAPLQSLNNLGPCSSIWRAGAASPTQ
jgi:hypothetical protein